MLIYLIFSSFCILVPMWGLDIDDAIANTRAVGAVLGGLLGGPLVGFPPGGADRGLHRYTLGVHRSGLCHLHHLRGAAGGWCTGG